MVNGCFPFSFYTFQECITVCKVRDILSFCGCIPSQYNNYFNATRCTLTDLSCLSNWKRGLRFLFVVNVRPLTFGTLLGNWFNSVPVLTEGGTTRSFMCPECLPLCNYVVYTVQSSSGFISPVNMNVTTYDGLRE